MPVTPPTAVRPTGATGGLLRRHADFRRLWAGDAVSRLGDNLGSLAMPLLALGALHATTFEAALLGVASSLPVLLIGLPAGAWCDRLRSRPVLVTADLGRALLFAVIPLAALLGHLTIGLLLVVTLLCGACGVFFDVAHQTLLPSLLDRHELVDGNGLLQTNRSLAYTVGRAVGGYLVQLLGSTLMMTVNAVSFVWSACWLSRIRVRENPGLAGAGGLWPQVWEGLRAVGGEPTLRTLVVFDIGAVLFGAIRNAVFVVYLYRVVSLSPGTIGVVGGIGGVGAVLGALSAGRLSRRWGSARALIGVSLVYGVASLGLPLATRGWGLAVFTAANLVVCFCIIALGVITMSACQLLCPRPMLGRVNATLNFLTSGASPIGGLFGGVFGTLLGVRFTVWVGGVGTLVCGVWLACGRLRGRRDIAAGPRGGGDTEGTGTEHTGGHGAVGSRHDAAAEAGRRAGSADRDVSPRP